MTRSSLVLCSLASIFGGAALLGFGCATTEDPGVALPDSGPPPIDATSEPPKFDGTGGCFTCSTDLHQVLDCEGNLVATCAGDQGCSPSGKCVSPCQAAAQNKSSIGCDYYTYFPDTENLEVSVGCFAVFAVNTWTDPVTITVERDGISLDPTTFAYVPSGSGQATTYTPLADGVLPPGQVAILFLTDSPASQVDARFRCPAGITPAMTTSPRVVGSTRGSAFRIGASAPIMAYDILPYGGGSSAITSSSLLLPVSAWGTNYVGVTGYTPDWPTFTPWIAIIADEDGTKVTLSPSTRIVGGVGVPPSAEGQPREFNLNRGQVLQLAEREDLIGTPIQSDKPVGVFGGNRCAHVPNDAFACDSLHQQLPPVKALGYEYVAVRYRDRYEGKPEAPPWRIVGAVNGTKLTYEPYKPDGAPDTIGVTEMVELKADAPFVVKAQDDHHPFYMAGYMTGCTAASDAADDDCRGDPEFVNVIPPLQYMKSYTFFTDPTYSETNLVVVRTKGPDGAFAPVKLDCAGELGGWQTVGDYEWTRIDLVRHDFEPQAYDAGVCNNGRHVVSSDQPFGVTVWGWGSAETKGDYDDASAPGFYTQWVSYAYPAGAAVRPLTAVEVPPVPR